MTPYSRSHPVLDPDARWSFAYVHRHGPRSAAHLHLGRLRPLFGELEPRDLLPILAHEYLHLTFDHLELRTADRALDRRSFSRTERWLCAPEPWAHPPPLPPPPIPELV